MEDGAASTEDIEEGDIIIDVDGKEMNRPNQLQSYVASKRAGDTIELNIYRDGENIERKITLKALDDEGNETPVAKNKEKKKNKNEEIEEASFDDLGLTVRNLRSKEYDQFKVSNGVLITKVKRFSKAENQLLGGGLIITEIDKIKIESVSKFEDIIDGSKGKAVLLKVVYQNGTSRFVGMEIPE